MRQLRVFSKWIVCITLMYLLISCSSNTSNDQEINDINYSISFKNTSELYGLPWNADDFAFNIIRVKDMINFDFQNTVNDNIEMAMTSWVGGRVVHADRVNLSITCHSSRYLSFINSFIYESRRVDVINDFITIDMQTGQRVFLNDLIEINEEFARFLQVNQHKIKTPPEPMWQAPPDLFLFSTSELLEELYKCSYTEEQWIEDGYYSLDDSIGSLIFKNSFFLREGQLVITIEKGGEGYITLDIADIDRFLKVEPW